MLFVGEREICPGLMSQESDSCTQFSGSVQNSFLVLMKPLRGLQATLPSLQGL